MPLIAEDNYDKSVLPGILKKDERDLVDFAVALGWRLHVASNGASCTLIAPDDQKKLHLGRRSSIPITRMRKDVIKWGDALKKAMVMASVEAGVPIDTYTQPGDPGTVMHEEPEPEVVRSVTELAPPEPKEVVAGVVIPNAHIVSIKPMLAKASQGKAYESSTTVERRWSDGTMDYGCSVCDYHSVNRLAIRSHYAHTHSTGKASPRALFVAEVPDAAVYAPRKTRVEALAEALFRRLQDHSLRTLEDALVIATEALTWVHEQGGKEDTTEHEQMTDTEMLARIRTLLDRGEMAQHRKHISDLEEQTVALTTRLEEAEMNALHQTERADRADSNMQAFRELVTELTTEKEQP